MSPKPFWHKGKRNKRRLQEAANSRRALQEQDREKARQHKHRAHRVFDLLWKDGYMTRRAAYEWLKVRFPDGIEHIAEMDEQDAERLIREVKKLVPVPHHLYN